MEELKQLLREYKEDYINAAPGYQSWSKTLKKNIPGKTQLRNAFIDNLNELMILCEDEATETKIMAILKKYQ